MNTQPKNQNKILLNNNARNHIRFFPASDKIKIPENEGEQIEWAKETFDRLSNDPTAEEIWHASNRKKGYLISVWKLDFYYIVVSLRNEFGTYNTTIYINDSENDSLATAKFLGQNYSEITKSYKAQILEAGEDYNKQVNEQIENKIEGTA